MTKNPQEVIARIEALAQSVCDPLELSCVGVRIGQQGKRRSLEVTIYRRGGRIALSDCEAVSRKLDELLEKVQQSENLIEGSFILEVESPGIDRKLVTQREFDVFSGQEVEIQSKDLVDSLGYHFAGKLVGLKDGKVSLTGCRPLVDPGSKNLRTSKGKSKHKPTKSESKEAVRETESQDLTLELKRLTTVKLHFALPKNDN